MNVIYSVEVGKRRISVKNGIYTAGAIDAGRVNFIHIKNEDGSNSFIARPTAEKYGYKIYPLKNGGISFNVPAVIKKKFVGERAIVYKELTNPMPGELFRLELLKYDFITGKKRDLELDPYFTKNSLVLPRMFINSNFVTSKTGYKISFSATSKEVLDKNIILAYIHNEDTPRESIDDYKLKKYAKGLRTSSLSYFKDFVENNCGSLTDFKFIGLRYFESTGDNTFVFRKKRKNE